MMNNNSNRRLTRQITNSFGDAMTIESVAAASAASSPSLSNNHPNRRYIYRTTKRREDLFRRLLSLSWVNGRLTRNGTDFNGDATAGGGTPSKKKKKKKKGYRTFSSFEPATSPVLPTTTTTTTTTRQRYQQGNVRRGAIGIGDSYFAPIFKGDENEEKVQTDSDLDELSILAPTDDDVRRIRSELSSSNNNNNITTKRKEPSSPLFHQKPPSDFNLTTRKRRSALSSAVFALMMIAFFVFVYVSLMGAMSPDGPYDANRSGYGTVTTDSTASAADSGGSAGRNKIGGNNNNGNENTINDDDWDYIVVGGGSSGIIAATSLAEAFPNLRIVLLESGTDSQSSVVLQKLQQQQQQQQQMEQQEQQKTARTTACVSEYGGQQGLVNRYDIPFMWSGLESCPEDYPIYDGSSNNNDNNIDGTCWPMMMMKDKKAALVARGLGGGDLVDPMIHMRASARDFDQLNNINVSPSPWNYQRDLLPLYDELEELVVAPNAQVDESTTSIDPVSRLFVRSAVAAGHARLESGFNEALNDTVNNRSVPPLGVGFYDFKIKDGKRNSVARALLGREQRRRQSSCWPSNLDIRTGVTVTRIIVATKEEERSADDSSKFVPTVTGVEYVQRNYQEEKPRGGTLLLRSNGAVLLAGGAILTPQLLMQSGIEPDGPVANLTGVGSNLQDHPMVVVGFQLNSNVMVDKDDDVDLIFTFGDYMTAVAALEILNQQEGFNNTATERHYLDRRLGILGTAGFSTGAFLQSPWATDERPDLQLTVFPRPMLASHEKPFKDTTTHAYYKSRAMVVTVALLQPEARYEIKPGIPKTMTTTAVDASNQNMPPSGMFSQLGIPSIEVAPDRTDYLTTSDVIRLAWGIKQVRSIVKLPPLSKHIQSEVYPKLPSRDLLDYIQQHHHPSNQWVGTTKMGPSDDELAVVDERLRVHGVHGLRIVGAGIVGTIPTANIRSTICVLARRAVDLIIQERREQESREK